MNSRTKGHNFERQVAEELRSVWPDCYTTRFKGSPWLDQCGVDLVGTPGFNFQLKALERAPAYHDILASMPDNDNVNAIIHKKNNRGCVVVIRLSDFMKLVSKTESNRLKL